MELAGHTEQRASMDRREPRQGTFPVSYSILSADALMREVAAGYDIGKPIHCQLLRPGMNDLYFLAATRGHYFVRVYGAGWRTNSEVAWELDLAIHLDKRGVGVCAPLRDREGSLQRAVSAPEGVRPLVLLTCAEGKPVNWRDREHCRLAGRMTASIHDASNDFVGQPGRFSLSLEYLLNTSCNTLETCFAHRPADWAYLTDLSQRLHRAAGRTTDRGVDWGLCHNDLANRTLHIGNDGSIVVFDLDRACPGRRVMDFVPAHWLADFFEDPGIFEAFVSGYREVRPLSDADWEAVPLFRGMGMLWAFGLEARNSIHWGASTMSDSGLDYYLNCLREWEAGRAGPL